MGEDDLPAPAAPATQLGRQLAASGWAVSVSMWRRGQQPAIRRPGWCRPVRSMGAAHVTTTAVMGAGFMYSWTQK